MRYRGKKQKTRPWNNVNTTVKYKKKGRKMKTDYERREKAWIT